MARLLTSRLLSGRRIQRKSGVLPRLSNQSVGSGQHTSDTHLCGVIGVLSCGETNREVAVAEHRADAVAPAGFVFDDGPTRRTTFGATAIVVVRNALALERARQAVGPTVTDSTPDRLGDIDVEESARRVETHSGYLPTVVANVRLLVGGTGVVMARDRCLACSTARGLLRPAKLCESTSLACESGRMAGRGQFLLLVIAVLSNRLRFGQSGWVRVLSVGH